MCTCELRMADLMTILALFRMVVSHNTMRFGPSSHLPYIDCLDSGGSQNPKRGSAAAASTGVRPTPKGKPAKIGSTLSGTGNARLEHRRMGMDNGRLSVLHSGEFDTTALAWPMPIKLEAGECMRP